MARLGDFCKVFFPGRGTNAARPAGKRLSRLGFFR